MSKIYKVSAEPDFLYDLSVDQLAPDILHIDGRIIPQKGSNEYTITIRLKANGTFRALKNAMIVLRHHAGKIKQGHLPPYTAKESGG